MQTPVLVVISTSMEMLTRSNSSTTSQSYRNPIKPEGAHFVEQEKMPHESHESAEYAAAFLFISRLEKSGVLQDPVVGMLGREKGREEVAM